MILIENVLTIVIQCGNVIPQGKSQPGWAGLDTEFYLISKLYFASFNFSFASASESPQAFL